jgi:hypothetical protein
LKMSTPISSSKMISSSTTGSYMASANDLPLIYFHISYSCMCFETIVYLVDCVGRIICEKHCCNKLNDYYVFKTMFWFVYLMYVVSVLICNLRLSCLKPCFTGSDVLCGEQSPHTEPVKPNILFYGFSLQARSLRQHFPTPKTRIPRFILAFYRSDF